MKTIVILLVLIPLCAGLLDVQCRYENLQPTGRVICECSSFSTSSSDYEDLAETIYNFVNNRFRQNLPFSSVALNNCRSLKISVDFGSLAPLSSQKVSYISFQNTDNLQVYLSALDSGDKTVIVDNVAYLTLSGRMYERAASMRFFVRNSPSVLFEDFYATTPILLINLMDINSVKVTDSGFENVATAEFVRVSNCQNEDGATSCSQSELFRNNSITVVDTTTVMLIVGVCLLIAAIVIGIGIALYIRRWRKKNDLELLGYPPKVAPPPRSNLSPTTFK